jgi:Uma2 family endonuclease
VTYEDDSGAGGTLDNTAYILCEKPATVRIADLSFVRAERVPPGGYSRSIWRLAPDLAIEVLSPSNRASDVQETIVDYLEAGVPLIWIVDPERRTVTVHRSRTDPRSLREFDRLNGGNVLPGLSIPLDTIFRR